MLVNEVVVVGLSKWSQPTRLVTGREKKKKIKEADAGAGVLFQPDSDAHFVTEG
jgi:hypothetical protein